MLHFLAHVLVIALCVLGAVACGDNLSGGDDEDDAASCNPHACPRAAPYCCDVDAAPAPDAPTDADPYACLRDGCCEACCNPSTLGTANCCQEPPEIPDPTIVLDVTACDWWPAYADAGAP